MRFLIVSDLHLTERQALDGWVPFDVPENVDACIIAGDVSDKMSLSLSWIGRVFASRMPTIFVPGNHEFYGAQMDVARRDATRIAEALGIDLLDNSTIHYGNIRLIGSTLWTDFDVYAKGDGYALAEAMFSCRHGIADFHTISMSAPPGDRLFERKFLPKDALYLHKEARRFIENELDTPHRGKTIIVTHHAPHERSIAPSFRGDLTTPGFVSDLSDLFARYQIDLWVHGHTHTAFDYIVPENGKTRVVCNPRGYLSEYSKTGFTWPLIIEF